jgi:hypothetical protein
MANETVESLESASLDKEAIEALNKLPEKDRLKVLEYINSLVKLTNKK